MVGFFSSSFSFSSSLLLFFLPKASQSLPKAPQSLPKASPKSPQTYGLIPRLSQTPRNHKHAQKKSLAVTETLFRVCLWHSYKPKHVYFLDVVASLGVKEPHKKRPERATDRRVFVLVTKKKTSSPIRVHKLFVCWPTIRSEIRNNGFHSSCSRFFVLFGFKWEGLKAHDTLHVASW